VGLWPLASRGHERFPLPRSRPWSFGQVSPNQADWGSVGALRRRLVGDGGNGHPGPTLGLVRAEVYGAGCHSSY
jgi:hypothetical protein